MKQDPEERNHHLPTLLSYLPSHDHLLSNGESGHRFKVSITEQPICKKRKLFDEAKHLMQLGVGDLDGKVYVQPCQ